MNENVHEREENVGEAGHAEQDEQDGEGGHVRLEEVHPTVGVERPAETRDEHDQDEIGQRGHRGDQVDVGLRVVAYAVDDENDAQDRDQVDHVDGDVEEIVGEPVDEFARVREDLHLLRAVDLLARDMHHVDRDHQREKKRDRKVEDGQRQNVKTAQVLEEIVAVVFRVAWYQRLVVGRDCLAQSVFIEERKQQIADL